MIGIFDSGVGGLGIFLEIKKLIPNESILYLADSANCPYGEKTDEQIKKIVLDNTNFLIGKGCDIIVIACNTASTIALEYVREILTIKSTPAGCTLVRVVGVVPVVKTAAEISKNKRIGILATTRTIKSKYLLDLVEKFCPRNKGFKVYYQAANELVELVENPNFKIPSQKLVSIWPTIFNPPAMPCKAWRAGQIQSSNVLKLNHLKLNKNLKFKIKNYQLLQKYLQSFIKNKVDTIALGCTHFPFLKKEIQATMGPRVKVLDSNGAVARQVRRIANSISHIAYRKNKNNKPYAISNKPVYQFYTSGDSKENKTSDGKFVR